MRVEGVSLDQMLVALYEQNKDAFVGGNMNRLKVGKVVKLPSKETLLATGKSDANKVVQIHVADWNAYRNNLAGTAAEAKNSLPTQNSQSESGKIEPSAPVAPSSQAAGQDVVKLSAGDKDKLSKDY
jgi:pilus assembly protein FimV